jgi:tetratricopeptide (TPR) repeat protein
MDRITRILEMLKLEEHDSFLQHALALEYIKIGNDDEAKKLFANILNREPNYLGSYYHLGKLLERIGRPEEAIPVYQKGMKIAKAANDSHTYNELQAAYEDVKDELG